MAPEFGASHPLSQTKFIYILLACATYRVRVRYRAIRGGGAWAVGDSVLHGCVSEPSVIIVHQHSQIHNPADLRTHKILRTDNLMRIPMRSTEPFTVRVGRFSVQFGC